MKKLTSLTIHEAIKHLEKGDFSVKELVQDHITEIDKKKELNAYLTYTYDQALAQADAATLAYKNKTNRSLEGIPLAHKDLFCTKGIRTTSGSKMLENFSPPYESTVTSNFVMHGALSLGKLNMDEFAMGSANLNSAYGPVINPWKSRKDPLKKLTPGGSSGGSAAAVSANIAMGTTGSDTGGSIRQPAAFCGIVGIKPTYGLCSRYGMIAFASSLDQAGPLGKDVRDTALLLEAMASFDEKDATSIQKEIPPYSKDLTDNLKGLKVGIPVECLEGLQDEQRLILDQGVAWLREAGCEVKEVSLKMMRFALPVYYIIAPAEASSNLARFDGVRYGLRVPGNSLDEMYENTRAQGFGHEVKRRIMIGTYVLSAGYYDAFYTRALKIKHIVTQDIKSMLKEVDVILTPTTPTPAFGLDEKIDPISMFLNDLFTVIANLAGIPGISVPAGVSADGLPIGLQFLGARFSEQTLFNCAYAIEKAAGFQRFED
jgi:aspartyl-tRNA(Asn)/glutamyl-tRNA(Gln) amidotransferase subunit A